jgi:CheY-like chemotaxis protein
VTDRVGPGPRILLVEDEPANRALVRAIIARTDRAELKGTVLHEAATIAEAGSVLASHPVDIVLVDVRLPDGNGLDLATELRAHPGADPVKVVIVSASVLPAERTSALATGADAFLAKPFDPSDLVDLLVRLSGS